MGEEGGGEKEQKEDCHCSPFVDFIFVFVFYYFSFFPFVQIISCFNVG